MSTIPIVIKEDEPLFGVKASAEDPIVLRDVERGTDDATLLSEWERHIDTTTNFAARDIWLEAMRRRSLRPTTWLRKRDTEYGLYPDIGDPEFAALLRRKTEFASLSSVMADETVCNQSGSYFDTTPVQRLVARFLHPSTPYTGILLNHGVGVGKTCTAITVAETYLEIMPTHTVFILCPQSIADGFKRTIFNVNKLVEKSAAERRLTGERWSSPQCTGMTYLRLTGMAAEPSKETIVKAVERVVRRRYAIMGYLAFANWVDRKLAASIPNTLRGEARIAAENDVLRRVFSDHMVIVDEAHNLRDSTGTDEDAIGADEVNAGLIGDAAAGKKLTPFLKRIVGVAEGMRLMLMTATPMYNTAPEILFLLNLLDLNDSKDSRRWLNNSDVFKPDGKFNVGGEQRLITLIRRYVSYMRGENPNTFPLRFMPPERAGAAFIDGYPTVSLSKREGTTDFGKPERETERRIFAALPLVISEASGTPVEAAIVRRVTAEGGKEFILDELTQMGNIVYPDTAFGGGGFDSHFKATTITAKGMKVTQFVWQGKGDIFDVFGPEGLWKYAPKMHRIVQNILNCVGISFVYSRYVKAGALPMAMALELAGGCRVLADGTRAPLLKRTGAAEGREPTFFYALLTANDELSPDYASLINYATTFKTDAEAHGSKIKVILGSKVSSEGLDLKCIREVHLLDGWYHLNRADQITGRGVRFCSHISLPPAERNCTIFFHALSIPTYETADLYAYRVAVRKAVPVGIISRLLKIHAWDCMLNHDAIELHETKGRDVVDSKGVPFTEKYVAKDQEYTSMCDYSNTCEYICGSRPIPGVDLSTEQEFDYRRTFAEKAAVLADIFSTELAYPLEAVKAMVYDDIPWSIAKLGLRELLGSLRIKRQEGIYGTLILQNGYVVFQPEHVTDTRIPLALRSGRAYGRLARTLTLPTPLLLSDTAALPVLETPATAAEEAREGEAEAAEGAAEGAAKEAAEGAAAGSVKEGEAARPAAAIRPAGDVSVNATEARAGLAIWRAKVTEMLTKESGVISPPVGIKDELFNGIRWVFWRFRSLEETPKIALKWFVDKIWTAAERKVYLDDIFARGIGLVSAEDREVLEVLKPVEYFTGAFTGYYHYNAATATAVSYCMVEGETAPTNCPSAFQTTIDSITGPAVNRMNDTDDLFGMLVSRSGEVVFKTVDKTAGKVIKLEGAECANQSNLLNHEPRLLLCQRKILEHAASDAPIRGLLLDSEPSRRMDDMKARTAIQDALKKIYNPSLKAANPELRITHITHMSLKQVCPYMEFLLRYCDMKHYGGKRWFLPLVESVRAGAKMGDAK